MIHVSSHLWFLSVWMAAAVTLTSVATANEYSIAVGPSCAPRGQLLPEHSDCGTRLEASVLASLPSQFGDVRAIRLSGSYMEISSFETRWLYDRGEKTSAGSIHALDELLTLDAALVLSTAAAPQTFDFGIRLARFRWNQRQILPIAGEPARSSVEATFLGIGPKVRFATSAPVLNGLAIKLDGGAALLFGRQENSLVLDSEWIRGSVSQEFWRTGLQFDGSISASWSPAQLQGWSIDFGLRVETFRDALVFKEQQRGRLGFASFDDDRTQITPFVRLNRSN